MRKFCIAGGVLAVVVGLAFRAQGADVDKGKEVFDQCAACHNADSTEKKMGPGLKGLFQHEKLKNGKKPTDAVVLEIINKGGNGMPSYADLLSDEEKTNLLAYLHTL
jgi:mono/diheme cytochrome c family protein